MFILNSMLIIFYETGTTAQIMLILQNFWPILYP